MLKPVPRALPQLPLRLFFSANQLRLCVKRIIRTHPQEADSIEITQRTGLSVRLAFLVASLMLIANPLFAIAQTGRDLSTGQRVLANTEWHLVSFGSVGAEVPVISRSPITLKFESDGHVNGSGGCNSYRGSYRVQGDRLTFSQILSTKRACIDANANRQEAQYFSALQSANRFRLSSGELGIYYDGGRSILEFANDAATTEDSEPPGQIDDPIAALGSYYRAINEQNYQRAYRYWETPSQTIEQFIRGFAETASVQLFVDPSPQIEGAAGSSFAKVPTVLISRQKSGQERLFAGCYVMRKSNLRAEGGQNRQGWRIYRANLAPIAGRFSSLLTQRCRE
jgi:heat shock protein HslJ